MTKRKGEEPNNAVEGTLGFFAIAALWFWGLFKWRSLNKTLGKKKGRAVER